MKHIILSIGLVIASVSLVFAQPANNLDKKYLKEKLKNEFKLSDAYADSLISVQFIYDAKAKQIKDNPAFSKTK